MGNGHADDRRYMMGRSEEETARLLLQARVNQPATRRFLADAGIASATWAAAPMTSPC